MAVHWHAAVAVEALVGLPRSQCRAYVQIKSTKLSAAIFAAPHQIDWRNTIIVALVKKTAITTHLALVTCGGIVASSVLIALIVLGRAGYAGGADCLGGANDASRASCAEWVLVLITLTSIIAVGMLVAVTAPRVLLVPRHRQLHGRGDHAARVNCGERADTHNNQSDVFDIALAPLNTVIALQKLVMLIAVEGGDSAKERGCAGCASCAYMPQRCALGTALRHPLQIPSTASL